MKKAKKVLVFLLVLALTHSMSLSAFASSDKSNNGKGQEKHSTQATVLNDQVSSELSIPAAWTFTQLNNNLVKFESPDKKGGKILIPMQAIKHQLGLEVECTGDTLTFSKGDLDVEILFGVNGITATSDTLILAPNQQNFIDITSGHAYVPLKYLSEIFSITQPALIASPNEDTDETTAGEPNDTITIDTAATTSTE